MFRHRLSGRIRRNLGRSTAVSSSLVRREPPGWCRRDSAVPILGTMDDELDLADAAEYILGERPGLDEHQVWAVLRELGEPPAASSKELALHLITSTFPEITP